MNIAFIILFGIGILVVAITIHKLWHFNDKGDK
jgi:hypothetical protein